MTEEQKTKNHYEMLNNSSNKALVDLIKMQDNKIEQLEKQNKELQEERDKYRNMVFDKDDQLTKAKNLLQKVADVCGYPNYDIPIELYADIANYIKDSEVEK